jgi:hypothetical protein
MDIVIRSFLLYFCTTAILKIFKYIEKVLEGPWPAMLYTLGTAITLINPFLSCVSSLQCHMPCGPAEQVLCLMNIRELKCRCHVKGMSRSGQEHGKCRLSSVKGQGMARTVREGKEKGQCKGISAQVKGGTRIMQEHIKVMGTARAFMRSRPCQGQGNSTV